MPNPQLAPGVRDELLAHLTVATIQWTEDVMKGFFEDPDDTMAQQMVLEAFAAAVATIASRKPSSHAVMQTFLIELQDRVNSPKKETP